MTIQHEIAEQHAWMRQCGGDLAGYVTRYGTGLCADHYGDGGELIYAADVAALAVLLLREQGHTGIDSREVYRVAVAELGLATFVPKRSAA